MPSVDLLSFSSSSPSSGKCLFLSGLTQQQLNYSHDQDLPRDYGIGFTNMVERTTPGSKDLSRFVNIHPGRLPPGPENYCDLSVCVLARRSGREVAIYWTNSRSTSHSLQRSMGKVTISSSPLLPATTGQPLTLCVCPGIYEIFCKETFGVKAKNLEFGLQPYKIPETETVSHKVVVLEGLGAESSFSLLPPHLAAGVLPDAFLQPSLRPVPSGPGQGPLLHQIEGTAGPVEGGGAQ